MSARKWASSAAAVAALGAAAFAGYKTRDRWEPYVFPPKSAKPAGEGGHAHGEEADPHAGHDHGAAGDRVKLSAQAQANLKLDADALAPQEYWRTMLIPGVVVDRPGESDRGVVAKSAGVVTEIKARPGDTVRAGDPLFTIQLVGEFAQAAQADLVKAAREQAFATAKRDRLKPLIAQGVSSEAAYIEQENDVRRFASQVQTLRRQLLTLGLTPAQLDRVEQGEIVTHLSVAAPARSDRPGESAAPPSAATPPEPVYEVQELKVQLGESVQAGQALCLLSSHQRLFVEGRAFKSEAKALATLAEKQVPVAAEFADEAPGDWPAPPPLFVHHLSNQVDPATRTFAFYLPLDNQPSSFQQNGKTHLVWRFRPGQRVRLRVPVEKLGDEVLVLPAGAVVREGAEAFAFVQNGDVFVRKPVRVVYEDRSDVVVANDGSLPAGAFVVRNQAAALNRAVKAAAGGDAHAGHSHEH
jgi:cobalt-zinc-cadmium efflux system membrane fusion protein